MFLLLNLSVFLSAFLLFLIQPMIANMLMPKVGGSPNIWNACMVFFQVSLLVGYFYSYLITQKLSLKRQTYLHTFLLCLGLFFINFNFQTIYLPLDNPVLEILFLMLQRIAFPFILLSTTSPLLQRWLSLSDSPYKKVPYSLYVCSNVGSLIALLFYPLVVEHFFSFSKQGKIWHFSFLIFFLLILLTVIRLNKDMKADSQTVEKKTDVERPSYITVFCWIFFAFVPSSLMLGVTNHISVDIGGLPFLWIIPLSLYLLSFIITFSRFYTGRTKTICKFLYKIGIFAVPYLFFFKAFSSAIGDNAAHIAVHCLFYFIFCIVCHGILADKKPSAENLTFFYLCLSIGGALGGLFNTFAAPLLFNSYAEYPAVFFLSAPFVFNAFPETAKQFTKILASIFLMLFAFKAGLALQGPINIIFSEYRFLVLLTYVLIWVCAAVYFVRQKNTALILFCLLLAAAFPMPKEDLYVKRNFFGTLRVVKQEAPYVSVISLMHGTTVHGIQRITMGSYDKDPSAYYGMASPVEDFFKTFKSSPPPQVALMGLGGGALLCYPPQGSKQDIFEIDRDVIEISTKHRFFRYMETCAPKATIQEGDARIEIAKEQDEKYDILILDVFSSHFIPVHLITKEAIQTYRQKMKPDGLLLIHISARLFDIEPILSRIAEELGMIFIVRQGQQNAEKDAPRWGVMAKSADIQEIKELLAMPGWRIARHQEKTPLWTDDFHNLLSTLRKIDNF